MFVFVAFAKHIEYVVLFLIAFEKTLNMLCYYWRIRKENNRKRRKNEKKIF